jgi:hypothetical protein
MEMEIKSQCIIEHTAVGNKPTVRLSHLLRQLADTGRVYGGSLSIISTNLFTGGAISSTTINHTWILMLIADEKKSIYSFLNLVFYIHIKSL